MKSSLMSNSLFTPMTATISISDMSVDATKWTLNQYVRIKMVIQFSGNYGSNTYMYN